MKTVYVMLVLLLVTSASLAQTSNHSVVRCKNILGVISAIDANAEQSKTNLDNKVSKIDSGTFPWTARGGNAEVNLSPRDASFGLVINGTVFRGTPGPVSSVTSTLVNAGDNNLEAAFDTAPVSLSAQGNASFSGQLQGIPATCANPIFLIRIDTPAGARGTCIAAGVERSFRNNGQ